MLIRIVGFMVRVRMTLVAVVAAITRPLLCVIRERRQEAGEAEEESRTEV